MTESTQPPPLPGMAERGKLAAFLSFVLALFLVDAALSLMDSALVLLGVSILTPLSSLVSFLNLGLGVITYCGVGFCPAIPKRYFLPLSLFLPLFLLLLPLLSIYYFSKMPVIFLGIVLMQCGIGIWVLWRLQGDLGLRWPLVRPENLSSDAFRLSHLAKFGLWNALLGVPLIVFYLCLCAHLAVDHFSGGFLELRFGGLTGVAKKYVRSDGKSVQLIPMMHVGDAGFYQGLSESFPSNSIILMEGVSDVKGRLKTKLSYKKMAQSLGLDEQREHFIPSHGLARAADVDVDEFSSTTLTLLNLVARFHSKGPSVEDLRELAAKGQSTDIVEALWRDILTLRNEHLLREVDRALLEAPAVMVPWGAAHMPGIAAGIELAGFRLTETQEYEIANFRRMREHRRAPP